MYLDFSNLNIPIATLIIVLIMIGIIIICVNEVKNGSKQNK